jgi:hypothetical protein
MNKPGNKWSFSKKSKVGSKTNKEELLRLSNTD